MKKPYYLVINGPLGCGKTTTSLSLATQLPAKYISLDKILHDEKLDIMEPGDACIKAPNFKKALDIAIPEARKYLGSGEIVIFDGCFYHQETLDYLLDNLDYDHYLFTLTANEETCVLRDKHRKKPLGEEAARAVYSLVNQNLFGTVIETDEQTEDQTLEEVLLQLSK